MALPHRQIASTASSASPAGTVDKPPKIAHNILFHHEKRSLSSQAYNRTDCSICLPTIGQALDIHKYLISSSEEEECAPGGLYTGLVARRLVVVGLTLLVLLQQFQVLHWPSHSVVVSLPWLIDLTVNLSTPPLCRFLGVRPSICHHDTSRSYRTLVWLSHTFWQTPAARWVFWICLMWVVLWVTLPELAPLPDFDLEHCCNVDCTSMDLMPRKWFKTNNVSLVTIQTYYQKT